MAYREWNGRVGQPTRSLRRRDLKPAKEQSDAQLLASAARAAEAQQRRLEKQRRAEQAEQQSA